MESIKTCVDQFFKQEKELKENLYKIQSAILNLQSICAHDMEYDSYHNYFVCKFCKHKDKR